MANTPEPTDPAAQSTEAELAELELSDEWVNQAKKHEQSADDRAERYARINRQHQTATPPRAWTPAGADSGSTTQTWVKATAIVLIIIAVLGVLTLLRAWG